jgi:hypothetical protein
MKKSYLYLLLSITLLNLLSCSKEKLLQKDDVKQESTTSKIMAPDVCGCSSMPTVITTKNLVTDFGATPNDGIDDSKAFICAAKWLSANWSNTNVIQLYIPSGTYLAGIQLAPGQSFVTPCTTITNTGTQVRLGIDMIKLDGCKNIKIFGDPGTQINYNNGLYFGGYTAGLSPVSYPASLPCAPTTNNISERADIGTFINLRNCSCINISNIKVFGNNTDIVSSNHLGGHISECNGYQLGHDGIIINGSNNVSVTNVSLTNFCRDGIMVMNNFSANNPQCAKLTNVLSLNNSRQGLSLTAGDNLTATGCQFSNTGSVFYNNPGCGLDIEPEFSGTVNNAQFIKCEFIKNAFCGMISDNHPTTVNGVTFDGCNFLAAPTNYSISVWPRRMQNTLFKNCTINGTMVHVSGNSTTDMANFSGCTITDQNNGQPATGTSAYLLNFGATGNTNDFFNFSNCKFSLYNRGLIYTTGISGYNRVFSNNSFQLNWSTIYSSWSSTQCGNTLSFLGRLYSCTLNSNSFSDLTPASSPPTGVQRYALLAQIGAGIQTNGANSFPTTPGQYNHFFRQIDICCCTVSNANF